MGSDDLFKKNKARQSLARRKPSKKVGARFLIVCEGSKTEPNYFKNLKNTERINADIEIIGEECGSDPLNIIEFALNKYNADSDFDHVYCVFDRDAHVGYMPAINRIKNLQRENKPFTAIVSNPSFEYWYLLHFKDTRSPFNTKGRKTPADCVESELRREFKQYCKNHTSMYSNLKDRYPSARDRSKRIYQAAKQDGNFNPSTQAHELVEALLELAKK